MSDLNFFVAAATPTMQGPAAPPPHAALVPANPPVAPTARYRTFTFGVGFLCGQASLIFIAVLFLRYVVFEDPKKALREAGQRKKKRLRNKQRQRRGSTAVRGAKSTKFTATTSIPASDQLILSKLNYNISEHPPESCDWLNVLMAQAVSAYRSMILDEAMNYSRMNGHDSSDDEDAEGEDADKPEGGRGAKRYVEKALNTGRGEGEDKDGTGIVTLDYITVTEFDFGQSYPVCSNARVRPSSESGKVRIEVDIDYSDHISLAIETKVLINFPRPRFAVIPVNLALALVQFSATLTFEVPPPSFTAMASPESSSDAKASMSVSLHPDFILDLASTSLIGSRAKLQDIPKVEQLIIGRIRNYVIENFVWPKVRTFNLPKVGGKKKKAATAQTPSAGDTSNVEDSAFENINANGQVIRGDDNTSLLQSPSSGSALEEEEEDDEFDEEDIDYVEEEDDVFEPGRPPLHVHTIVTPETSRSRPKPSPLGQTAFSEAQSSALRGRQSSEQRRRRPRRASSLSSTTTASDLLATSSRRTSASSSTPGEPLLSPTSFSARSDTGLSAGEQRPFGHPTPLQSPQLGMDLRHGPSKRYSIQSYFPPPSSSLHSGQTSPFPAMTSAYNNALSRTSSVSSLPSLPTILSPRAENPSHKLADLLGSSGSTWEAARRAEAQRRHQP